MPKNIKRRSVLKIIPSGLMIPSILGAASLSACTEEKSAFNTDNLGKNIFVSTWDNENANLTAHKSSSNGKSVIDSIVDGISYVESDIEDMSVGYGGRPDRDGDVTLDSCIMDADGNAGGVCFMQNIEHPIQVARDVMYKTPHVLLAGEGAKIFALSQGHKEKDLMTDKSEMEYKKWLENSEYKPIPNIEMHDTIGMLGYKDGKLGGGCSTSGLAYKLKGRVGDSPIIGAGLFVDGEVGGCTATGMGELMMKSLASFLVVEFMRDGLSPTEACKKAIDRIDSKLTPEEKEMQVGLLAIDKSGNVGGYGLLSGFVYSVIIDGSVELVEAGYKRFFEIKEE